jgi:hypothetical protein
LQAQGHGDARGRAGREKDTGFDDWRTTPAALDLHSFAEGEQEDRLTTSDAVPAGLSRRLRRNRLSRRDVLWLFGAGAAAG